MISLILNGRMIFRRKASCLLVILFAMGTTVFLLVYPLLIYSAQKELEYAYDSIEVSGWLINSRSYDDPIIESSIWHALLDSGYISTHNTYATNKIKIFDARSVVEKSKKCTSEKALKEAFDVLLEEHAKDQNKQYSQALNVIDANEGLYRQREGIQWLQGYSENCLSGDEKVCIVSKQFGYQLGDWVPLSLEFSGNEETVVCLKVVGVYSVKLNANVCVILPIQTLEKLFLEEGWVFNVNGFSFIVKDNRNITDLKDCIIRMGLDGKDRTLNIRTIIDDRVLSGTVSPIKSNIAMMEGLYRFFYIIVATLGFFLCLLLIQGRKPEYYIMRLLGENSAQVTIKVLLEQVTLCLLGIGGGVSLLWITGQNIDMEICGIILACHILSSTVAVLLTVRVSVMEILQDKE